MIIHKLIQHHLKNKDDPAFYKMQALDAIGWMEKRGIVFDDGTRVLDLGCGHGIFGGELRKKGCAVVFADEDNYLTHELTNAPFHRINLDTQDVSKLGVYDVVVCSNVLEHLSKPLQFLASISATLRSKGYLYLSWTNWLSPWGGHEFSPWHYFGSKRGHVLFDRVTKKSRIHTPGVNLFPTYIGETLKMIRQNPSLKVVKIAPRYYPELGFITEIPLLREFVTWNCAMLIQKN